MSPDKSRKLIASSSHRISFPVNLIFSLIILSILIPVNCLLAEDQPVLVKYSKETGDVISYIQKLDLLISLEGQPEVSFRVSFVWLVKTAVLTAQPGEIKLVSQYNLRSRKIYDQEKLEEVLDNNEVKNLLLPYQALNPIYTRIFTTDEYGQLKDHSYNFMQAFSLVNTSIIRILELPRNPLLPGQSYKVNHEENEITVNYLGTISSEPYVLHYFKGNHPGGSITHLVNSELGVTDRLEYEVRYRAAGQVRNENFSQVLLDKKRTSLSQMSDDPEIRIGILRASLQDETLPVKDSLVGELLKSNDPSLQILAAAFCSLRGIPAGLDLKPLLKHKNPMVRFNLAKAMYLQTGDLSYLQELSKSSDEYLKYRAKSFLTNSDYVRSSEDKILMTKLRRWFYQNDQTVLNELSGFPADQLKRLLAALKPENPRRSGFFKYFFSDSEEDRKRPYYIYLPDDYDPAEKFPVIIYLGMGEGRGDLSLLSFYNALKTDERYSRYILVVPQAHGLWWDKPIEQNLKKIWREVIGHYSVDTNQIYLAGSSNGGIGTIFYATSFPDRLAAIAENMGFPLLEPDLLDPSADLRKLQNLLNTRVLISHGLADEHISPEGNIRAYQFLKENGVEVYFKSFRDRKHNIDPVDIIDSVINLFQHNVRNPYPDKINFVISDPEYLQCYWIRVLELEAFPAEIKAEIKGNEIRLLTENIRTIRLYLDQALVDLSQPVKIINNGQIVYNSLITPTTDQLLLSVMEKADPTMSFGAILNLSLPK